MSTNNSHLEHHFGQIFKSNYPGRDDKKIVGICGEKKAPLRQEIPFLTNRQLFNACLGNSEKVLLDLLRYGWHYAFTEILDLLQREVEETNKSTSPNSASIVGCPDILAKLKLVLSEVEYAQRKLDDHLVFMKYKELADYFEELNFTDKIWVRNRYVKYMMSVASRIKDDFGYKQANALQYYAEIKKQDNKFDEATAACLEMYELSRDRNWVSLKGEKEMELMSCKILVDTYLAEIKNRDIEEVTYRLVIARKAVKIGLLSKNYELQVYVNTYVSELMEKFGTLQDALEFNKSFFHLCLEKDDSLRLREICLALERLHNRAGRSNEVIKYLHKFAQVAELKEDWVSLCMAFQLLGMAFDRCSDFESSLKWNRKAYDMPKLFIDLKEEFAKVNPFAAHFFGINKAHSLLSNFKDNMSNGSVESILRIIRWKGNPTQDQNSFDPKTLPRPLKLMKDIQLKTTFESFYDECINMD